jgi:NifU-like protein involved in Fe-S cluster formation
VSSALYTTDILRLAASTFEFPRLANPDASSEKRSPVCGSQIIVDVALDASGHISAIGQEVKACALGQASATLLGRHIAGKSGPEVEAAKDQLQDWLAGQSETPGDWPGLSVFEPARRLSARHPAILLPFEAATQAAKEAAH